MVEKPEKELVRVVLLVLAELGCGGADEGLWRGGKVKNRRLEGKKNSNRGTEDALADLRDRRLCADLAERLETGKLLPAGHEKVRDQLFTEENSVLLPAPPSSENGS